jgi:hypothetical protein
MFDHGDALRVDRQLMLLVLRANQQGYVEQRAQRQQNRSYMDKP